jgi:hypothetical protein
MEADRAQLRVRCDYSRSSSCARARRARIHPFMNTQQSLSKRAQLVALFSMLALSACGGNAPTATSAPRAADAPAAKAAKAAEKDVAATQPKADAPAKPADAPTKAPVAAKRAPASEISAKVPAAKDALMAYKKAKSYRTTMSMSLFSKELEGKGPLMTYEGAHVGENAQITYGGAMLAALGEGLTQVEYISVDGKVYLRGPFPSMGVNDDGWYELSPSRAEDLKAPGTPFEFVQQMADDDKLATDLEKSGSVSIGAQTCDVLSIPREKILADESSAYIKDFSSVSEAEMSIVVCPDGYMHKMTVSFVGKQKNDPTQDAGLKINVTMSDFDKVADIRAPKDAKSLDSVTTQSEIEAAVGAPTSNDGFDTTFPLVGKVSDFNRIPSPTNDEVINYSSDATLKDIYAFYVAELTKNGMTERKVTTVIDEKIASFVMDGAGEGKSVIVQAVWLDTNKRNVNVSVQDTP